MATPKVLRKAKMQVYKQNAETEVYKVNLKAVVWLSQMVIREECFCKGPVVLTKLF